MIVAFPGHSHLPFRVEQLSVLVITAVKIET